MRLYQYHYKIEQLSTVVCSTVSILLNITRRLSDLLIE